MYHIISKARDTQGKATVLLGNIPSRDDARAQARELEGTVKTDAELTQMVGDGKIASPATSTEQEPTAMHPAAETAEQPAAEQPAAEQPAAEQPQEGAAAGTENKAPATISGAADAVAHEQAKRTTVGKKAKPEPKRVKTPDDVLADARTDLAIWAKCVREGTLSKVEFVRNVALWNGRKLQRSDAILLTAELQLGIAPATVSTQFQFARSDRMTEHAEKAAKRQAEAKDREAKKAAAKAEREAKAKAKQREAEKVAKAAAKEADKKAKEDEKAAKVKADAEAQAAKEAEKAAAQEQATA